MGDSGTLNLLVVLDAGPDADESELQRSTRRLRAEIVALDVDSVAPVRGAAPPPGAKGLDVSLGALLVALSATNGVFVALVETVRDWLGRQPGAHKVSITVDGETLELERATAGEQRALVDAFIARHTAV